MRNLQNLLSVSVYSQRLTDTVYVYMKSTTFLLFISFFISLKIGDVVGQGDWWLIAPVAHQTSWGSRPGIES